MENSNSMAAALLSASSSAYAAYAANRLIESSPQVQSQFGEASFADWKDHYQQRIFELAAAIAENEPRLFSARVDWSVAAFQARDVSDDIIRQSLDCLKNTLLEELPEDVREIPCHFIDTAITSMDDTAGLPRPMSAEDKHSRLAMNYLVAVLEGDARRGIDMVVDAVRDGLLIQSAYLEVLIPAQREVGRMWHLAEINVAEEHHVTATTRRAMSVLNQMAERKPLNGKTVVSAGVSGNIHDLGILTLSDFFEMDGWRAICLGGDTPAKDIALAASSFDASLLLLSAALSTQLRSVREVIDIVRQETNCKVMVGGMAFSDTPEIWEKLGADGFAGDADEALQIGRRLVDAV